MSKSQSLGRIGAAVVGGGGGDVIGVVARCWDGGGGGGGGGGVVTKEPPLLTFDFVLVPPFPFPFSTSTPYPNQEHLPGSRPERTRCAGFIFFFSLSLTNPGGLFLCGEWGQPQVQPILPVARSICLWLFLFLFILPQKIIKPAGWASIARS